MPPSSTPFPRIRQVTAARMLVLLIIASIGAHLVAVPAEVFASNGDSLQVPLMTGRPGRANQLFSQQSGLQVTVDSTWVGNRGYRPVRVTINSSKPASADTLITIVFSAGHWRSSSRAISVEADMELPSGATSSTSKLSVPQYVDWNLLSWEIWVDGVKDEELCVERVGFSSGNNNTLAVGRYQTELQSIFSSDGLLQSVANGAVDSKSFDLNSMPENWIDYTALDTFVTTLASMELTKVSAPQKLTALLRWVRAGGNLLVLDLGQDFAELPELDELLHPAKPAPTETEEEAATLQHWRFLKYDDKGQRRLKDLIQLSMDTPDAAETFSTENVVLSDNPTLAVDSRNWFVAHAYGLGTIIAFQNGTGKLIDNVQQCATALDRAAISDNLDWATRHGNDPGTGNPSFNNLLIPDVGAAPVFEFQLLITLFVIAIGPLNYWLLRRRNQLPLLVVTVPLAALATTVILFTYGFLADGFGVLVRTRTISMLDQPAGEVSSWARLSYYAGIAPSDGLSMPQDTALYPIQPAQRRRNSFGQRVTTQQRLLQWSEGQLLKLGWLGSRTPTQYLALTARETNKRLQFAQQGESLKVTNRLGTEVLTLVTQDEAGRIFLCNEVAPDGTAKMEPTTYVQAASKIRTHLAANTPQLPAGYTPSQGRRRNQFGVSTNLSLMELQLEAIVSPLANGWGKRTYVAITAEGIEVPLGLENITETDSFHVVRGKW